MANFAVINGGTVNNIIVAEDISVAQETFKNAEDIIEVPIGLGSPALGWSYDKETGKFTNPETLEVI